MKLLTVLVFLMSAISYGEDLTPQNAVENVFKMAAQPEITTDVQKQSQISAMVDFSALATAALGKAGKTVSASEQAWFKDTLKEIITRTVYPKAPEFLKGVQINYDAVVIKKNIAVVKSTVQNKSDLTEVEYKLEKNASNEWHVIDVSISGLSWVDSIKDQVSDLVKKKKWAGLKEAMNKRLADIKAGKI